jgi:hypothetical protein
MFGYILENFTVVVSLISWIYLEDHTGCRKWVVLIAGWEIANLGEFILTGMSFYLTMLGLMLGVSALHAYWNSGFPVTLALAAAPLVGFFEVRTILELVGPVRPTILEALGNALLFGIPVGIVGFLLGTGARRLVSSCESGV